MGPALPAPCVPNVSSCYRLSPGAEAGVKCHSHRAAPFSPARNESSIL